MSLCLAVAACPALLAQPHALATPTVIVDAHGLGAQGVRALTGADGVIWHAEFGSELLLGVDDKTLPTWLARDAVRAGPARLAFDQIVVRDHVCTVHSPETPLAVIGGYQILRRPPALVRATKGAAIVGEPLPEDGVVARLASNAEQAVKAKGANPTVAAMVAKVNAARWFDDVEALAAINRNSFSDELPHARDWLLQRLADAGLQTGTHSFTLNSSSCGTSLPDRVLDNPWGLKRGGRLADEWVVIGGHYDSRNSVRCDGVSNLQPGANDNASGCAGVLELARVFRNVPTERSLLFICFSGEEQGLIGSLRYVQDLIAEGRMAQIKHMVNLDMIGHAVSDNLDARVETNNAQQALLAVYASAAATYAPELNLITSAATQAYSDHWYFLTQDVPSVFTWENGAGIYPQYHAVGDLPSAMLRAEALAGGILKMDTAVLAEEVIASDLLADSFEGAAH
ncbi:MAG: M28 family peptidase [Lysobacteraceae bacterium]